MIARTRSARGGKGGHEPRARITRREQVALDLSIAGKPQAEIARALDISQPAVSKILKRLGERWEQELPARMSQSRMILEARCRRLYEMALDGYDRSRAERIRKKQRKLKGGGRGDLDVAEVTIDQPPGDARHLAAALAALEALERVLGIKALVAKPPVSSYPTEAEREVILENLCEKLSRLTQTQPESDRGPDFVESTGGTTNVGID